MKNIRNNADDLRSEYKRSDFGEIVQGKHASTPLKFAELVRLLLTCIGEDEGVEFSHHSVGNHQAPQQQRDWTYEIDEANRITLRYWLSEFDTVVEPISNPPVINTPEDRSEIQSLLLNHVQVCYCPN
jgi:hypothetical protein